MPNQMTILRNTRFLILWSSQTISNSGDAIFSLAVIWFILSSTNSILLVGLIVAASFVPEIIVAPVAGTFVDRFNRRTVLTISYLSQGVLVGGAGALYMFDKLGFAYSLLTVIGLGIGEQFTVPANGALLPNIVRNEELVAANGLISSTNSLNMLGSNAVGGIMILLIGLAAPFEYDAITFLLASVLLIMLPHSTGIVGKKGISEEVSENDGSTISQLIVGFRYLRKDGLLLKLTVLSTVVSFFALGLQGIYAPYVRTSLHGGPATYGFFLASFGIGSMVGSLLISKIGNRIRTGTLIMLGLLGQAGTITLLGFTHIAGIAILIWGICGLAQVTNIIPYQSFLQARIPSAFFGRVSTLISALVFTPAPILILITSAITTRLTPGLMLSIYGLAMLLSVLASFGFSRELRSLDIKANALLEMPT